MKDIKRFPVEYFTPKNLEGIITELRELDAEFPNGPASLKGEGVDRLIFKLKDMQHNSVVISLLDYKHDNKKAPQENPSYAEKIIKNFIDDAYKHCPAAADQFACSIQFFLGEANKDTAVYQYTQEKLPHYEQAKSIIDNLMRSHDNRLALDLEFLEQSMGGSLNYVGEAGYSYIERDKINNLLKSVENSKAINDLLLYKYPDAEESDIAKSTREERLLDALTRCNAEHGRDGYKAVRGVFNFLGNVPQSKVSKHAKDLMLKAWNEMHDAQSDVSGEYFDRNGMCHQPGSMQASGQGPYVVGFGSVSGKVVNFGVDVIETLILQGKGAKYGGLPSAMKDILDLNKKMDKPIPPQIPPPADL